MSKIQNLLSFDYINQLPSTKKIEEAVTSVSILKQFSSMNDFYKSEVTKNDLKEILTGLSSSLIQKNITNSRKIQDLKRKIKSIKTLRTSVSSVSDEDFV